MHISPIYLAQAINNQNIKQKINNKASNPIQIKDYKEIPANSIAEVAGRSQVSFKGTNKNLGPVFIHECSELFGKKENIQYNKEDGSFVHTIANRDGGILRQEEYYPIERKEVIKTATDSGLTINTSTPNEHTVEKLDKQNRQVLWQQKLSNGDSISVTTEYENNRRIIRQNINGTEAIPQVIDIRTGQKVTSGPLTIQRVFDDYSGSYITENIITGEIYQQEKFGSNNKLLELIKFNPQTNLSTFRKTYNNKTGGYDEYTYYPSGLNKTYASISKNGRDKDLYFYAQDGKTIIDHRLTKDDKYGNVIFERIYNPVNNKIIKETDIKESSKDIYTFAEYPNIPKYKDTYRKDFHSEHVEFHEDGKTYASMTNFGTNGSRKETIFDRKGNPIYSEYYTTDNFMYKRTDFSEFTGKPTQITERNRKTGENTQQVFDEFTGYLLTKIITSANGKIKEITDYYQDGKGIPKEKKEYNPDGSYRKSYYDETGRKLRTEEFNADNTRKGFNRNSSSNSYNYDYRTRTSNNSNYTTYQQKQATPLETLNKILSIFASRDRWDFSTVSEKEWDVLLKYTGFATKSELFGMNTEKYRQLTKKFHPDLNANNPELHEYETIFKILTSLHSTNKQ